MLQLLVFYFIISILDDGQKAGNLYAAAAAACMQVCQTHMVLLRSQLLLWASLAEVLIPIYSFRETQI